MRPAARTPHRRFVAVLAAVLAMASGVAVAQAGTMAAPSPPAPIDDARLDALFVARTLVDDDGRTRGYRVFVPRIRADGPRPVILFLHGSGERGDDNRAQTHVGLGPAVAARSADFPAIVVFPQAAADGRWAGRDAEVAIAALDAAIAEFGGDPRRVYLTGMSRGGYGVWELALAQPQRFAALVPVCGGIRAPQLRADLYVEALKDEFDPYGALATRLRDVPAWLLHGTKDDLVPPENSRLLAGALLGAGADVHYTEFPDANHNAWDPAYAHAPMWTWLFAQRQPATNAR